MDIVKCRNALNDKSINKLICSNTSRANYKEDVNKGYNDNESVKQTFTPRDTDNANSKTMPINQDFDGTSKDFQSLMSDTDCHKRREKQTNTMKESTAKLLVLLGKILSRTELKNNSKLKMPKHLSKPIQPHEDGGQCSIYNRLTRKCQCLNSSLYNDFILKFNENVKHSTCDIGEIIKNMRVLKKFLYMEGEYARNALMFLREGLTESPILEKDAIVQGCIHADICNIFEDHSMVTTFIICPGRNSRGRDCLTQMLTGILLCEIAGTEDGCSYLNLNSKIIHDVKKALKKRCSLLNKETVEWLNTTLYLLQKHFVQYHSASFINGSRNKGKGTRTLLDLINCRNRMTISEISLNLKILRNYSKQESGKRELRSNLAQLIRVLRDILRYCDSSELNITAASLVTDVVSKSLLTKLSREHNAASVMRTSKERTKPNVEANKVDLGSKFKRKELKMYPGNKEEIIPKEEVFSNYLWESKIPEKIIRHCHKTRHQAVIVPVR